MAMNSLYIGIHRLTYDSVTSYMYRVYIINKSTVCELIQKMLFNFSKIPMKHWTIDMPKTEETCFLNNSNISE